MPKPCYCHEMTVGYVEMPQGHSLGANGLLMGWKDLRIYLLSRHEK